ncbi:MAG: S9 family peptidase [Verrucomicrobiae bacterium]|nr:S9 family peptidase [Verrucomicrobiae bacterium]
MRYLAALRLGWAFGWLGLAAPPVLSAPQPVDTLNPEHIAEMRSVGEVALSPDGRHVAFTRSVPRRPGVDEDGEAWVELWVLDIDPARERPFITGKVNVQSVGWTRDGRHVAFLAKRGDDTHRSLHLIPIDGGEARRALSLASDISSYAFAPDGQRVAVLAAEPEDETRKKLKEKGFKQEIYEEDWRFTRVWLGQPFAETNPPPAALALTGSVRSVRWSPSADRLAVAVSPTPSVDDGFMRQQILIVGASTNAPVLARVDHAAKLQTFEWNPDGTQLALITGEDLHDPSAGRLMVVSARGGRPRDLLPNLEAEVSHLAWSAPDQIVYVTGQGALSHLARVGLQPGAAPVSLHGPGRPIIAGFSLSADGSRAALAAHTPAHPAEVFTVSLDVPAAPVRRTDSNPWLAGLRLAPQEIVRHRARDGLDIEGILIRPLQARAGTRYPLILAVHGGPEAHVSDGWVTSYSLPGQVAAARGFAVFYPNYRGSTGRGVPFSKLGQGDAAGREFDDLVDGVDHLITIGLVDRARVGVTGGSYGGYATAWCSTRYSDRFAAGVMFVGISDKISKFGTTDIPDEEYLVHARKRPWEDWRFQLERSPIYHAGNSRTPLLILHGAADPRVHPAQSLEMYRHLKLRSQAPVRLVLYPGEGHGNRRAAARYDYHLRMLRWFEHYLQGPGGAMPPYDLDPLPGVAP